MMQSSSSDNCVHCYDIEILNLFDLELLVINTKPMIKNNLKELLREFKTQSILVLDYKKRNSCKISHSSTKLIAGNSGIDQAFISMHQSIMAKIKNYAGENYDCFDVIIKHSIKIFEFQYKENKQHKQRLQQVIYSNFLQTKSLFSENISNNCQTKVYVNNIVFTLKIRLFI